MKAEEIGMTNIKKLANMLEKAVEKAMQNPPPASEEVPRLSTSIKFRPIECKDMAQPFKREFIENMRIARLIKSQNGYEIRYRRNGFNVTVFHENLAEAKQLFIAEVSA